MSAKQTHVLLKAKYRGEPNSLGYVPGRTYQGWLKGNDFFPIDSRARRCPYTAAGFLRVFTDIEILEVRAPER